MKIRSGYVSNSSSSSFVLYSSDNRRTVANMLVDYMLKDSEYTEDEIREAIGVAIAHSGDKNLVHMYVYNSVYFVLYAYSTYYRHRLSVELLGIDLFKDLTADREVCIEKMREAFDNVGYRAARCPVKIPKSVFKHIRRSLRESLIQYGVAECRVSAYHPELCSLVERWMQEHPKACVLEFSSDDGDAVEAELRYNLDYFATAIGTEYGFYSNNS